MATVGASIPASSAAIIMHRLADNDVILHWQEQDLDTGVVRDKDMTGIDCWVTIYGMEGQVWLFYKAPTSPGGIIHIGASASQLSADIWASRRFGRYIVTATRSGHTDVIVDDLIRIL